MGNRAVIAFKDEHREEDDCPAIYLHWNGSEYSVEAFLKAAKAFGIRGDDPSYCMARLTQVIGNTIGGTLSLGVGCYGDFGHPGDNGVYWIKNWEIVRRDNDYEDEYKSQNYQAWHEEVYHDTLKANKKHFDVGAKVQ
tara:strand:- start:562 stop:975 length:414 start_codon:yes stop_codon:yes gene_type:complete